VITPEKELEILERISRSKTTIRQRDLARIIGLSLGMTNAILKRLASKGLLKIKKVNNRNIHYVVSSKGMEAITSRSYGYLKRTIRNVVYYKEAIGSVIREAADRGYRRIVLVGKSDLDFIVEHFCIKNRVEFSHSMASPAKAEAIAGDSDGTFVLFSENASDTGSDNENTESLRKLFMSQTQTSIPSADLS
jgi:DNA-binding MarR family transcriptional regulator